ncbi:CRISPR-associated endonuclease Cas9 [Corynebacterium capitovis DSM 44611]|uniref:HNH endonuclease family protein n=1 Tax=Corynebacterium capitovis TaxID=131081 RepID=UPI000370B8A4|nr:HNH endonuclease family protein [Corynebacterium capitovis]WKD57860.1 CRISPR-associated endonuclease Cas9 [Corynebacterium capitovis DSM 44611]
MRFLVPALIVFTLAILPFPTGRFLIDAPAPPRTVPQRVTVLGYERDAFGAGWGSLPDGCTSREALMAAAFSASCHIPYRSWDSAPITDPYSGAPLSPEDVEIDHVFPLSAAWDLGAHSWTDSARRTFANDPANLIVTSSKENQAKSDQLPSEWLPSDWRARCAYVRQVATVAARYDLPLPRADLRTSRRQCSGFGSLFARDRLIAPVSSEDTRSTTRDATSIKVG